MDDRLYQQEIIQDAPFPGEPSLTPTTPATPVGTYLPTTSNAKEFPVKKRAVELLSTALNTRSRKILQEFKLEQSGGIQVGNFQEGQTGDVRITPNGITGRNVSGLTTFGLDIDGNLILIGELRAGSSIVADTIVTEQASNGNGRIVFYNNGVAAILIGDPS